MAEEMGSSTGPYPTEAAAESHSELGGPSPLPQGGEVQSATTAPPSVVTEGHTDLEASGPTPSTSASPSATVAGPVCATVVGSSPGFPAADTAGAGLANGQASPGYSGARPTLPATPDVTVENAQLEKVADPGPPAIASRTAALPTVASTPGGARLEVGAFSKYSSLGTS